MRIKKLIDEDYIQFQNPSMFIGTCFCSFKCGAGNCQNTELATGQIFDIDDDELITRYLQNPLTSAIVFGGLEPFDQYEELKGFLSKLRSRGCVDPVVIYSGYTTEELENKYISDPNLIVKVGRYIPNRSSKYDALLGVELASDNQYAVRW